MCTFNIGLIENHTVKSFEEAQKLYDGFLARGEEGAILKDKSVLWEDTRSKMCIKMKAERDADLLCVGIVPGTGKYEGKIGSLVCQSSDGLVTVNVGSGLSDEDRSQGEAKYLNKIIEVVYNEKIKSKDGTHSLFLPRFIAVREDKNTANSFKEIK
jgi:DNA ligase-1